jgi:GNAT superfamily N-acetyltransferase
MNVGVRLREMPSEVSASLTAVVYKEILEPSFGPDELDPLGTLLEGLSEGDAWGLCALDGETPVGCVLGYPFPASKVLLIGYLAVKPDFRSSGIGGKLMDMVQQRWSGKDDLSLVLAEVEDPRRHSATGDSDPKRRADFYARRGAQVIVGPYFQPRLDGAGRQRVHDLFLTVLSANSQATTSENSLGTTQLTNFLLEYFRDSGEGSDFPRAGDDEGNRLISWYRDRETVALRAIGDYARIDIPRISG